MGLFVLQYGQSDLIGWSPPTFPLFMLIGLCPLGWRVCLDWFKVRGGAYDFCFLLLAAVLFIENDLVVEHLTVEF